MTNKQLAAVIVAIAITAFGLFKLTSWQCQQQFEQVKAFYGSEIYHAQKAYWSK